MLIRSGYKFRLDTGAAAEALSRQFDGCNSFIWEHGSCATDNKQICLSYSKLCTLLTVWKKELLFFSRTAFVDSAADTQSIIQRHQ